MKKGYFVFVVASIVGVAVLLAGLSWWKKSESKNALVAEDPPIERLLFVKKADAVTAEQRQAVEEFKARILARARRGVELTEQEKSIFATVLSDRETMLPGDEIVVNQSILKFSPEEISLISEALKR